MYFTRPDRNRVDDLMALDEALIMANLIFEGSIVDSAAYLDGTREFVIEAESADGTGEPWRLTVSFRWPKEHDTPLSEGDLTLSAPDGGELVAVLQSGSAEEELDEDTGGESIQLALVFRAMSGEGSLADVADASVTGALTGEDAQLLLDLRPATG